MDRAETLESRLAVLRDAGGYRVRAGPHQAAPRRLGGNCLFHWRVDAGLHTPYRAETARA
jgi:hypothetical protein